MHRIYSAAMLALLFVGGCKQKETSMSDAEANPADVSADAVPIDPAITTELFQKWRSPRFGTSNPERLNNPVWEWLVKSRINAYLATERLNGPSAMEAGPGWCFDRFGQSSNQLPDGRVVFIAGEHEDSYDPDFYIYNDVVIQHPSGQIEIFGYPREVFPPTDFHSATLVSNRIVLIGNLGYPENRRPGTTPVKILDLESLAVSAVKTSGTSPGWIHAHKATLAVDGHSILIQRGKLDRGGEDRSLVENIDDWQLNLNDWSWERLTERRWPRWEVRRNDGEMNHLFDYQQAIWAKQMPELENAVKERARLNKDLEIPTLKEALGKSPDLELFARRYKPPLAHEELAKAEPEEEYNVHRIKVEGVVVRYVEEMTCIQMTVEGELPQKTLDILTRDLLDKLSALENATCEVVRL
jgi:hypothetical protein